jgi:hypothetical protein
VDNLLLRARRNSLIVSAEKIESYTLCIAKETCRPVSGGNLCSYAAPTDGSLLGAAHLSRLHVALNIVEGGMYGRYDCVLTWLIREMYT